jgi:hypothetical protein
VEVGPTVLCGVTINKDTILSGVKQGNLELLVDCGGLVIPMLEVEGLLVTLCAKLGAVRQPII